MNDRKVSSLHVAAAVCWLAGVALVVADLLHLARVHPLGLIVIGAAMTLNVRGFLCHMERRAERAFDIGREVGRDEVSQLTRH